MSTTNTSEWKNPENYEMDGWHQSRVDENPITMQVHRWQLKRRRVYGRPLKQLADNIEENLRQVSQISHGKSTRQKWPTLEETANDQGQCREVLWKLWKLKVSPDINLFLLSSTRTFIIINMNKIATLLCNKSISY